MTTDKQFPPLESTINGRGTASPVRVQTPDGLEIGLASISNPRDHSTPMNKPTIKGELLVIVLGGCPPMVSFPEGSILCEL